MPTRVNPVQLLVLLCFPLLFTSCLKDECRNKFTIYQPVYKSLSSVRKEMGFTQARKMERPGKIYQYGAYLLVNELWKGIHVFDNTNPASPRKLGFINILGNVDIAIRNNVLYADSYSDLAVIPVSNWTEAKPVTFRNKVFNDGFVSWGNQTNPDSVQVIVDYVERDTIVDCATYTTWSRCPNCMVADAGGRPVFVNAAAAAPVNGVGGSMARFTMVNDYLYTVTQSELSAFQVTDPLNPVKSSTQNLGWGIETIYPFQNKLFVGSNTGMFIFDLGNPATPARQGAFSHVRSCDPVIADGFTAYVTLRSGGTMCGGTSNQMDVININNLQTPFLVKTIALQNPHGLSKDGNRLFVCDGLAGLKIFDVQDERDPKLVQTIGGLGTTYDVIAQDKIALVVSDQGIFQFDYSNLQAIKQISKINLN
ncbi:LVIVD repeat-containing protein [Cnuella takakiae]|nr:hypothetical protein [Cnuella takakiae]